MFDRNETTSPGVPTTTGEQLAVMRAEIHDMRGTFTWMRNGVIGLVMVGVGAVATAGMYKQTVDDLVDDVRELRAQVVSLQIKIGGQATLERSMTPWKLETPLNSSSPSR